MNHCFARRHKRYFAISAAVPTSFLTHIATSDSAPLTGGTQCWGRFAALASAKTRVNLPKLPERRFAGQRLARSHYAYRLSDLRRLSPDPRRCRMASCSKAASSRRVTFHLNRVRTWNRASPLLRFPHPRRAVARRRSKTQAIDSWSRGVSMATSAYVSTKLCPKPAATKSASRWSAERVPLLGRYRGTSARAEPVDRGRSA
ncbi:hypothetical protein ACVW1A_001406 [Bradyrhizobium sp. LB1.3]